MFSRSSLGFKGSAAMTRIFGAVLLLLAAGCGDPATSKLASGQKVIAVPRDMTVSDPQVHLSDASNGSFAFVEPGTPMTVVADDDSRGWDHRDVFVRVEDGRHRGVTGKVRRWELRPSP